MTRMQYKFGDHYIHIVQASDTIEVIYDIKGWRKKDCCSDEHKKYYPVNINEKGMYIPYKINKNDFYVNHKLKELKYYDEFIEKILNPFKNVLKGGRHIRIESLNLNFYIRKKERYINGIIYKTYEILSIEVDEEKRMNGNFTEFLDHLEFLAFEENRAIYIEDIEEDFLYKFLVDKRNYFIVLSNKKSLFKPFC